MATPEERQQEVDRNFEEFQKALPDLLKTKAGQFALMRHGQIMEFYDTFNDAVKVGVKEYPDGIFSVQQVTQQVIDLGWFSHALPQHHI
jgi:hypothetical protein